MNPINSYYADINDTLTRANGYNLSNSFDIKHSLQTLIDQDPNRSHIVVVTHEFSTTGFAGWYGEYISGYGYDKVTKEIHEIVGFGLGFGAGYNVAGIYTPSMERAESLDLRVAGPDLALVSLGRVCVCTPRCGFPS